MDQHNRDLGRGGLRCARRLVLEGDDQVYPIANPLFGQRIGGVLVRQIAPIELNIFRPLQPNFFSSWRSGSNDGGT